jgi:hypothetical protein
VPSCVEDRRKVSAETGKSGRAFRNKPRIADKTHRMTSSVETNRSFPNEANRFRGAVKYRPKIPGDLCEFRGSDRDKAIPISEDDRPTIRVEEFGR